MLSLVMWLLLVLLQVMMMMLQLLLLRMMMCMMIGGMSLSPCRAEQHPMGLYLTVAESR